METEYNVGAVVVVKTSTYAGDDCLHHENYLESWYAGDMDTTTDKQFCFDSKRWPVGTKLIVKVPCCPNPDCDVDAEFQDENGKCSECGFDWVRWAEEQYS